MSEPVTVYLFAEDRAHEQLIRALVTRLSRENGIQSVLRTRAASGGHGRALTEFARYQNLLERQNQPLPDFLIVAIDGNCTTFARRREEIMRATQPRFAQRIVPACPDPHVERWFLADPDSFHSVVGHRPTIGKSKCARDHYKRLLADSVRKGGHPPLLGGLEFATELVDAMDLYRAGKNDASLKAFLDDLAAKLKLGKRKLVSGQGKNGQ